MFPQSIHLDSSEVGWLNVMSGGIDFSDIYQNI